MAESDLISSSLSLNKTLNICENIQKFRGSSNGIFYHDNPLSYTFPIVTLQVALVCLLTSCLQFLLRPIGETNFIPQVLAGMLTGPSILGQIKTLKAWLFAKRACYVSEVIGLYGTMMFLFLMSVKADISMIMRLGKKTWVIGVFSCLLPLMLTMCAALVLRKILSPEADIYKSLFFIAAFSSTGSFQVTTSALEDFKLLNSEVGQLAISSSMINGIISALWQFVLLAQQQRNIWKIKKGSTKMEITSILAMIFIILCVLRPIMLWMIRKTPKGNPVKESYIVSVYIMMLVSAFSGEVIGKHYYIGPLILGLAVPEGPPLGSALVERLDTLVSGLFMPIYYLNGSARMQFHAIDGYSLSIVQPVAIIGFFGKLVGTMLPSFYFNMSFTDSLCLGLVMCSQGFIHLLHLQSLHYLRILDDTSFTQMVIALIWLTAASNPILKHLYDPSKSYLSLNRGNTIEHAPVNTILPLMACIHCDENTIPMINFLEMSNSTIESPICFYVLHLVQIKGRIVPVLIDHQHSEKANPLRYNESYRILNAFKSYEQHSNLIVKLYTSISPYETMHDEICRQAAQKRVCMLIAPFHKQWRSSGIMELPYPIKALNRHLLRTAPCSVAILIERHNLIVNNPLHSVCVYNVGVVFIKGSDDREALAYAMRMASKPNVQITLIRLIEPHKKNRQLISRDLDGELIHNFKVNFIQIKCHDYKEKVVRDSVEMVSVIRSLEGCFDLILVGRRHDYESSLFHGLTEWIEFPELGFMADMLVSSDSTFDGSVLVVQQHNSVGFAHQDFHLDNSIIPQHQPASRLEVPPNSMVWPVI
ncbi:hypothetical protein VNO78_31319 [Psophocarpus tetragonolobus]|uniref:Cation/H+ exchanger domain-containing protein n=1 Tax=Psophocarpus tetragonolobus TaxID=3891 RepID=A0AAN9RZ44_PSOTE